LLADRIDLEKQTSAYRGHPDCALADAHGAMRTIAVELDLDDTVVAGIDPYQLHPLPGARDRP
jgi:hypothetical protein